MEMEELTETKIPPLSALHRFRSSHILFRILVFALSFIFFLFILLLIAYFTLLPYFVQSSVNDSQLTFSKVSLTNPDDNRSTILLLTLATLESSCPFPATTSDFVSSVFFNKELIGSAEFSSIHISADEDIHIFDQQILFHIANISSFNQFASSMMEEEYVVWDMVSTFDLELSFWGIKLPVNGIAFEKTLTLKGFEGFKNLTVLDVDASSSTNESIIVTFLIGVENDSVFEIIPVGYLDFDIFYKNVNMGYLICKEANLVRGFSILNVSSFLQPYPSDSPEASEMFTRFLGSKN